MSFPFPPVPYRTSNTAFPHTPEAGQYPEGNLAPLHLRAPSSNDSYIPPQLRRRLFSSFMEPIHDSPTYHRSRAVSSTMRIQPQTTRAAPTTFPPHVGGSGIAPPGRSRTVSSGLSMGLLVTNADWDRSFSQYDEATPNDIYPVKSQHTTGKKSHHSQMHPDQLPVYQRPRRQRVNQNTTQSPVSHNTHQPPDNHYHQALDHQNTHQPLIHQQAPRAIVNRAPAVLQQHPMSNDMTLIAAVTAARRDHREFPWYPVWVIAIKDWMFPNSNSNTATVACNVAPQYVLSHTHIVDSLSSPASGSMVRVAKSTAIPDFALLLQHVRTSSNGTPILEGQKVIMVVENKPTLGTHRYLRWPCPFSLVNVQIRQQAMLAFMSDPSLRVIGIIVAYGARWRYVEINRPRSTFLKVWMERGDAAYGKKEPKLKYTVPVELKRLSPRKDHSFELLDHMGLTAQAFEVIAQRIKSRESHMWSL